VSSQKRIPAHLRIRGHLLRRIQELPANARLPTEVELAKQFGVSRLTAHKAVVRLQVEGLVVRRGKGGTFVASEAHQVHMNGGKGKRGRLAIVCPNRFSYDFWYRTELAERLALQHGMAPALFKTNPDTKMEDLKAMLGSAPLRGVLLVGGAVSPADVAALDALGCPCVLLALERHVASARNVYAVSLDCRQVGHDEVVHLIQAGHSRIAYAREEPWSYGTHLVIEGMKLGYRQCGVSVRGLITPHLHVRAWDDSVQAGYRITRDLLHRANRPTAIVYDGWAGAHAGLRAAREKGLAVPADVSLIANGTGHPLAPYDLPALAVMATTPGRLVERAVEIILHPPKEHLVWLPGRLEPNESVAAPPADAQRS
jgi:DNA-binding LacI/PurR family transcriptional regulator